MKDHYFLGGAKIDKNSCYLFLGRLHMDANQFIMDGSFCYGKEHRLFSGSVEEHIKDMRALWDFCPEIPEWLTLEELEELEGKMRELV